MALDLAQRGANVMILYASSNSTAKAVALASEITLFKQIFPLRRQADILVNNAGTEVNASLGSITPEDFAKAYDPNVRAPLLLTQALLPRLNAHARIINISSAGGHHSFAGLGLYCSSKSALDSLIRCWARELEGNGTTVNCVAPSPVQSNMLDNIPREIVDAQKR